MAYSAGDTILDDEYNVFVNNSTSPFGYNHFAGPGASNYGLNQSTISTVSAGDTINASHWNALFTGMDNIANTQTFLSQHHQFQEVTPLLSDQHWSQT